MKAAVVVKPGKIKVMDVPEPEMEHDEALVRVRACGLCNGTDTKILHGHFPGIGPDEYPLVLGHEAVGEVVEVGKDVESFRVGDLVLEPYNRIPMQGMGSAWGAFAEYMLVRDHLRMTREGREVPAWMKREQVVQPGISPVDATILITLKETASALRNFEFKHGMRVLIVGDGPVGCGLAMFARIKGAELVVGLGHRDERLRIMNRVGAHFTLNTGSRDIDKALLEMTGIRCFDMVIDAVGNAGIMRRALSWVEEGGRVCMYGVASDDEFRVPLAAWPNNVVVHKLFFPVRHEDCHDEVVGLVKSGRINPGDFYSHTVQLDDIQHGFDLLETREAFKVVVRMG